MGGIGDAWRQLALGLAAVTTIAAAGGAPAEQDAGTSHPLELHLERTERDDRVVVEARVHNPGEIPVYLQIKTPEDFVVTAALTDGDGTPIEGRHQWATRGAPLFGHRFERIEPGGSVVIGGWGYDPATARASGGAHDWSLESRRGHTVQLRFHFTQDCTTRTTEPSPSPPAVPGASATPSRIDEVFCGALTSDPLEIDLPAAPPTPAR